MMLFKAHIYIYINRLKKKKMKIASRFECINASATVDHVPAMSKKKKQLNQTMRELLNGV